MAGPDDGLLVAMLQRGVSRRAFMQFCAAMAATLALPAAYAPRIAAAVSAAPRLPVIWLRGQDCAGNTEAFLRASDPTIAELLLDLLSIEYHETLMAPAGSAADRSLAEAMERYPDGYIAIVEGGVPLAEDGVYCMIGGRPFRDIVREVCDGALATIAVGSCAFDGGTPGASGGPTGAVGVGQVVPDARLITLPGCPLNVENLTATIVHYLTFKQFPVTDGRGRPLFAYGGLIHNQCERRAYFEFGQFVQAWGDEAAQKGWCLYKMGCKGPEVFANCPTVEYAEGTSWAVRAGTGCIGCTMPQFWDDMGPAYLRLPSPLPFAPAVTVDQVGHLLVGGIAAVTVVHGTASYVRHRRTRGAEHRPPLAPAAAGAAFAESDASPEAPLPDAPATADLVAPVRAPVPPEASAPPEAPVPDSPTAAPAGTDAHDAPATPEVS
jgi:hydrogenase small subunit